MGALVGREVGSDGRFLKRVLVAGGVDVGSFGWSGIGELVSVFVVGLGRGGIINQICMNAEIVKFKN